MTLKNTFFLLVLGLSQNHCVSRKPETPNYSILAPYFNPVLQKIPSKPFTGCLLAASSFACRYCIEYIIDNNHLFEKNNYLVYDSTAFKHENINNANVIKMSNDNLGRINIKKINGHRLYYFINDTLIRVKEINNYNKDSFYLFMKTK